MHPWNQALFDALKARSERFPHALLIHGARGAGKLALAEYVAQFLLCEGKTPPCGHCEGCRWFAAGSHPDFRRLEPEILAKEPPEPEEGEPAGKRTKPSLQIKIELADQADLDDTLPRAADFELQTVHHASRTRAMRRDGAFRVRSGVICTGCVWGAAGPVYP